MKRALVLLCLLATPVYAQTSPQKPTATTAQPSGRYRTYTLYGPTSTSCGGFTQQLPRDQAVIQWWLYGYVSGVGRAASFDLEHTQTVAIDAWLSKYCAEHPLDTIEMAGDVLVDELKVRAKRPIN